MLNKLAFRNAKRSAKDYLVYFVTMTMMSALMFAFDSMIFSEDVLKICRQAEVMGAMIGLASAFIVCIIAWLINYMVRFMLEKRSREFGTYLLLGMNRKQVSRVYMRENILIGIVAFLLGMGVGLFLQQILMTVFYQIFSKDYTLHVQISGWCMLLTVSLYVLCYLMALLRNRRLFKKMTISDFMRMEKEQEQVREGKTGLRQVWFFAAAAYFVFFDIMLLRGKYTITGVILITVGFFIAIYALYYGLSAFLIRYVKKSRKGIYKRERLFLLRQYISKLRTMRFTMGTLTVLFTCALLGGTVALMFAKFQGQALDNLMPFDILVYSQRASDEFLEEQAVIREKCQVEKMLVYRIYQDGSHEMNDYLYTHGDTIQKKYRNSDGTLNEQAVWEDGNEYYDYDTYIRLSDYNELREMLGYDAVSLAKDEYAIQIKSRMEKDLNEEILQRRIETGEGALELSDVYTIGFAQTGNNGADYLIVVPDEVCNEMKPYFSDLAVSAKNVPGELQEILEDIRLGKNGILPMEEFYRRQEAGEINEDADWEPCTLGGSGTDQVISSVSDVLVREGIGVELKFAMTSLTFPLVYIGLVFLCVALTIMAVQQLSDAGKYRFRYDVLSKLGFSDRKIDNIIFRQLCSYYLVPILVAVMLSAVTAVFAGNQFVRYTGANGSGMYYFAVSLAVFAGVYLIYFGITYLGFRRNVRYGE